MSGQPHAALQAAERCCAVLEQAGDALVGLDLPALLASEAALAEVVAMQPPAGGDVDAHALTELVGRARAALLRCKRLGGSFGDMARMRVQACSGFDAYDRGGGHLSSPAASSVHVKA